MHSKLDINLEQYLNEPQQAKWIDGIPVFPIANLSTSLGANSLYFGHPVWAQGYFDACHRDEAFKSRWLAATGSWDNKIVVDIGCGPGNVYASIGGHPRLLIGVDISLGALKMARDIGYTPIFADAQDLPLASGFADIVVINATLHHCDDMSQALQEAARLVRPGGVLVSDHDLQRSAWDFKGIARWAWEARLPLYRFLKRGGHTNMAEQVLALATEAHHVPGDGLTEEFFEQLIPLGFEVKVYPHNHTLGAAIFEGAYGQAARKYRLAQRLSGLDPNSRAAALSLMCVARRL